MNRFSRKTTEKLKNYVYVLVDPHNDEIFYVGKGSTRKRPFDHLNKCNRKNEVDKESRIKSIRSQGKEPIIEIIRHGLSSETALEVEAAVIDSIGIRNLTNCIRGQRSERGRATAKIIEQQLGGRPIKKESINYKAILFYCHKAYPKYNLYDSTRQFWDVSGTRVQEKIDGKYKYLYAFAMKGSLILDVFKILNWYPAGTTISTRKFIKDNSTRWEFIGSFAEDRIRNAYRNRVIYKNGDPLPATQKGFRYLG